MHLTSISLQKWTTHCSQTFFFYFFSSLDSVYEIFVVRRYTNFASRCTLLCGPRKRTKSAPPLALTMALLSFSLSQLDIWARLSANAHSRNVACRPIVLGSGVRHSLSGALANFPFSLARSNSEARLAKSLPAICYMLRCAHT
jgi:hypothetical protein